MNDAQETPRMYVPCRRAADGFDCYHRLLGREHGECLDIAATDAASWRELLAAALYASPDSDRVAADVAWWLATVGIVGWAVWPDTSLPVVRRGGLLIVLDWSNPGQEPSVANVIADGATIEWLPGMRPGLASTRPAPANETAVAL